MRGVAAGPQQLSSYWFLLGNEGMGTLYPHIYIYIYIYTYMVCIVRFTGFKKVTAFFLLFLLGVERVRHLISLYSVYIYME